MSVWRLVHTDVVDAPVGEEGIPYQCVTLEMLGDDTHYVISVACERPMSNHDLVNVMRTGTSFLLRAFGAEMLPGTEAVSKDDLVKKLDS